MIKLSNSQDGWQKKTPLIVMKNPDGIIDKYYKGRNRKCGCSRPVVQRHDFKHMKSMQVLLISLSSDLYIYFHSKTKLWKARHTAGLYGISFPTAIPH